MHGLKGGRSRCVIRSTVGGQKQYGIIAEASSPKSVRVGRIPVPSFLGLSFASICFQLPVSLVIVQAREPWHACSDVFL